MDKEDKIFNILVEAQGSVLPEHHPRVLAYKIADLYKPPEEALLTIKEMQLAIINDSDLPMGEAVAKAAATKATAHTEAENEKKIGEIFEKAKGKCPHKDWMIELKRRCPKCWQSLKAEYLRGEK